MEQAVAAPMCTRVLADFGARVIKVENPNGGDFARDYDDVVNGPGGLAAHFVWCNRGKESVTLNTKSSAGMELLHRLLDRADAFVSNLAPGATTRLGLTAADLAERHPNVIPVEITIYEDRTFDFITKTPPAAELIKKAAGLSKGSGVPHKEKVGKLTKDQVREIATTKLPDLNANDIEAAMKIVEGTARSMGVTTD